MWRGVRERAPTARGARCRQTLACGLGQLPGGSPDNGLGGALRERYQNPKEFAAQVAHARQEIRRAIEGNQSSRECSKRSVIVSPRNAQTGRVVSQLTFMPPLQGQRV